MMIPFKNQKHVNPFLKLMANIFKYIMPKATLTMQQVGASISHVAENTFPKQILEPADIRKAAAL